MERHCQISFDENSFIVSGICANSITIDSSGDIDVTSLVEKLIQLIDTEDSIVLDSLEDASWDDKKKMIYKLFCKIIEKYNACLTENSEESASINSIYSEEDGSVSSLGNQSSIENSDNLPF